MSEKAPNKTPTFCPGRGNYVAHEEAGGHTRKGAETDGGAATALRHVETIGGDAHRSMAMPEMADGDEPDRLAPRGDHRCRLVTEDTSPRTK